MTTKVGGLKALDFIGAIELAYDRTKDDAAWLADITKMIAPGFGRSDRPNIASYFFGLSADDVQLGMPTTIGQTKRYRQEHFVKAHEAGREFGSIARAYTCDPYTLLSRVVGIMAARAALRTAGMTGDDTAGLRANATSDSGILIMKEVTAGHRLRDRELWYRFASHLGSALRLRRFHQTPTGDSALAVLTPTGRLEHGSRDAIAAKNALGNAAKAIDRARGKLRRLDPDAAAALWRTMVNGEWSLVDWYDHDGKRFLLAQENRVPSRATRALTPREEQVVACAAMGHSNKLIAYDLGISVGSVAVLLGRAARKLGVSRRVALVRAFRERHEP